jgi:hypothetical protein
MPRKRKTDGPPRPKDSKKPSKGRAVKGVQRAIERTKPPKRPSISSKADQAKRKPGVATRIRKLEILQDVTSWIRKGLPDVEVARRIHDQGFCEEVALRTLTKDVLRYRTEVMSPSEVLAGHPTMSKGVLEASKVIEEGVHELKSLEADYKELRERLHQQDKIINDFVTMMDRVCEYQSSAPAKAGEDPVPKTGGALLVDELRDAWGFDKITWKPPAEIAVMNRADAVRYLLVSGPAMKRVQGAMKEANVTVAKMTDILVASANIKDMMGMLHSEGPSESSGVLEAELTQVVVRKYPGDIKMQEAFLDPAKRAKALNLVKKVLTRKQLQEGPKDEVIETEGEPVERGEA